MMKIIAAAAGIIVGVTAIAAYAEIILAHAVYDDGDYDKWNERK